MTTFFHSMMMAFPLLLVGCGYAPGEANLAGESEEVAEAEVAFPDRTGALHVGLFATPRGAARLAYEQVDDTLVFEGDIILDHLELDERGDVATATSALAGVPEALLWPEGVLPYSIDASVSGTNRIGEAMALWERLTPIRFVERTSEKAYVTFRAGSGCSSSIGRTGKQQFINIGAGCSAGNIAHEIGHAVGLWHEHSRSDRDENVNVLWENIQAGKENNFRTWNESNRPGLDIGDYDVGSIMHYPSEAFSANGRPTLVRKDGSSIVANRRTLSPRDIAAIQELY